MLEKKNNNIQEMEISSPKVSKRSGPSVVWIIPLVTLLVGGWLIVKTLSDQGPQVSISFKTAEGIEVGKTRIKYKNVDIGTVEQIKFSDDFSNVILTAEFNKGSEKFLRRSTRFWVVKPQLSLQGASGLSTLISGAYIEIEPGPGAEQRHFVGLEKQPVVNADEEGVEIVLITQKLGSIDVGSPIYYQGLLAGEVLGHELGNDRKSVYVHAFIKDPFDQLVRGNTNFWNVSGVNVSMSADGFKVQTESLRSIIFGGIAFDTPETLEQVSTDIDNLVFTLHDSFESIQENAYTRKLKFMMFFNSSVRGLNIGAPVEFKGIKVGSVVDVRLEFDNEDTTFRIPVLIEIELQRIIERGNEEGSSSYETLDKLVERGLRARLQTGSLLTSQLYVELDMHPDTPINISGEETSFPELPTLATANFGAITASAENLLAKLNAIDIEEVTAVILDTVRSADSTIKNANALITIPGIPQAVEDMQVAMSNFKNIMQKVDASNIQEAINAGHIALESLTVTLDKTNNILEPNSPAQYNLIKLTGELEETARSIRSLVETLERNPQALIFGKEKKAKGE
ncbi:MAG: MCE family protein [Proteobacteria bacterium]|nr:MCE family protein [Pseudomonadota bacterium]